MSTPGSACIWPSVKLSTNGRICQNPNGSIKALHRAGFRSDSSNHPSLEESKDLKRKMTDREQYTQWLESLTDWTTKLDMTFEWNCDEFRARRCFQQFMAKELPGSTYLFSVERDPLQHKVAPTRQGLNQACHVHAISDTNWGMLRKRGVLRKDIWQTWKNKYGRCRIEPCRSVNYATGYALKKIINYSEKRIDQDSHIRKTDVDWDIEFGKGRRGQDLKNNATRYPNFTPYLSFIKTTARVWPQPERPLLYQSRWR